MVYAYDLFEGCSIPVLNNAVCVFGVFDGVHRGHQHLINLASKRASLQGKRCIAITFDIDPDEKFKSNFKKLMSNEMRIDSIQRGGVDDVCVLRFTDDLSKLPPLDFLDRLFSNALPSSIFVGSDLHFGFHAKGDLAVMKSWGFRNKVQIEGVELLLEGGKPITSTRIREHLAKGEVREANALLAHSFILSSTVLPGRQAGRDMGFRTANLEIPSCLEVLKDGVYSAYCLMSGTRYKAGVSVGVSPTFEDSTKANVEAHILDFDKDIYGSSIELHIQDRIRDMRKFNSMDELISTINSDFAFVRETLD